MPLETRAKVAAEKLLLLTESLSDAVLNSRIDEVDGLLRSRQTVLDQLQTMDIDAVAAAILCKVAESEATLLALMTRSKSEATSEMIQMFSGPRKLKEYQTSRQGRLLQTG